MGYESQFYIGEVSRMTPTHGDSLPWLQVYGVAEGGKRLSWSGQEVLDAWAAAPLAIEFYAPGGDGDEVVRKDRYDDPIRALPIAEAERVLTKFLGDDPLLESMAPFLSAVLLTIRAWMTYGVSNGCLDRLYVAHYGH